MLLQADQLAATGGRAVRVSECYWQSITSTKQNLHSTGTNSSNNTNSTDIL